MMHLTKKLAFVVRLPHYLTAAYKDVIGPVVAGSGTDDSFYTYIPGEQEFPATIGKATNQLCRADLQAEFPVALRETLLVLGECGQGEEATMFVVSDYYSADDIFPVKVVLDLNDGEQLGNSFVFCSLGRESDLTLLKQHFGTRPNCQFEKFTKWTTFGKFVADHYRRTHGDGEGLQS